MEKENRRRERDIGEGGTATSEGSEGEGKVCRCDSSRDAGRGEASGYLGERGGGLEKRQKEMSRQGHSSKTEGWG